MSKLFRRKHRTGDTLHSLRRAKTGPHPPSKLSRSLSQFSLKRYVSMKSGVALGGRNETGLVLHRLGFPMATKELLQPIKSTQQVVDIAGGKPVEYNAILLFGRTKPGVNQVAPKSAKHRVCELGLGKLRIYNFLGSPRSYAPGEDKIISSDELETWKEQKVIKKEQSYLIQRIRDIQYVGSDFLDISVVFDHPKKFNVPVSTLPKGPQPGSKSFRTSLSRMNPMKISTGSKTSRNRTSKSKDTVKPLMLNEQTPGVQYERTEEAVFLRFQNVASAEDFIISLLNEVRNQALIFENYCQIFQKATHNYNSINSRITDTRRKLREERSNNVRRQNLECLLRKCVDLYTLCLGPFSEKTADFRQKLAKVLPLDEAERKIWQRLADRHGWKPSAKANTEALTNAELKTRLKYFLEDEIESLDDNIDFDEIVRHMVEELDGVGNVRKIAQRLFHRYYAVPDGFEIYLLDEDDDRLERVRDRFKESIEYLEI